MGIVIRFPLERRLASRADAALATGSATIIILPVVRTERHADTVAAVAPVPAMPRAQRTARRRIAIQPAP